MLPSPYASASINNEPGSHEQSQRFPLQELNQSSTRLTASDTKIAASNGWSKDNIPKEPMSASTRLKTLRYSAQQLREMRSSLLSQQEPPGFSKWPATVRKGSRSPTGLVTPEEESVAEEAIPKTPVAWQMPRQTFHTPQTAPAHSRRALAFPSPGGSAVRQRREPPGTTFKQSTKQKETDERRIKQRAKQLSYGENTLGYKISAHPALAIGRAAPRAPPIDQKCSKRCWDAQVRRWRLELHQFDPSTPEEWRAAALAFPKECAELVQANADGKASPTSAPFQAPPADILKGIIVDSNDCSTDVVEEDTFNQTPMK